MCLHNYVGVTAPMAKILHHCWISPPEGSVPETHLPLSFLDFFWIIISIPIRRFFFFEFPHSTHHFLNSILPSLKHSLSLTLQHFFPLAGKLIFPPPPHKPHILFTTDSSFSLTVAESTSCDFTHLIANYPRDAKDLYPFAADLPEPHLLPNGTHEIPLMALQITVFPNQGLSLCMAFHHVVADGPAAHHFLKTWASINANGAASASLNRPQLPYLDRTIMKDPKGLESIFLQQLSNWKPISDKPVIDFAPVDKVRATFVLSKTQIERLKNWVSTQADGDKKLKPLRLSAFVVSCSLIWGCLIKSRETQINCVSDENKLCYLVFLADCRNRLKDLIPPAYFGNCLDLCVVTLKKNELLKLNNIVGVARAIGERIEEFEKEPLKMVDKWFSDWKQCEESEELIVIAGSPKLKAYDTDFGFGRPKKSEVLHVDCSKVVSVQESSDDRGGIELGLGLSRTHMDRFVAVWKENLNLFCS